MKCRQFASRALGCASFPVAGRYLKMNPIGCLAPRALPEVWRRSRRDTPLNCCFTPGKDVPAESRQR
jgi:hypothetical protein